MLTIFGQYLRGFDDLPTDLIWRRETGLETDAKLRYANDLVEWVYGIKS